MVLPYPWCESKQHPEPSALKSRKLPRGNATVAWFIEAARTLARFVESRATVCCENTATGMASYRASLAIVH